MASTCITTLFYLLLMQMTQPFSLKTSLQLEFQLIFLFPCFSGSNINKCEIAVLGILKVTQEAVRGLQNIDLTNDTIKILGIHFSQNKKIQTERNYLTTVKKIQKALNVWITRTLTLERKILIFKALGIFKIAYLSLIIAVPNSILKEIHKIQKTFVWYSSKPKINHKTFCNTFEDEGLKNVDVKSKIISLHCSWVKKYMTVTIMTKKVYHYILQTSITVKIFIFIQISLSIWLCLIVSQSSINKSLLIGVITLFPIPKFHLVFNPIFYGTINIYQLIINLFIYHPFLIKMLTL